MNMWQGSVPNCSVRSRKWKEVVGVNRWRVVVVVLAGLLAATTLTSSGVPAAEKKELLFNIERPQAIKTTFFKMTKILQEKGYKVDISHAEAAGTYIQPVLTGDAQIGGTDLDEVILAVAQGGNVKAFMTNSVKVDYVLVARPGIQSVKDLVGKRIGMSGPAGFDAMLGRLALKRAGYDPRKSVRWTRIGGSGARAVALDAGRIDAAIIFYSSWYQLRDKGAKLVKVADMAELAPDVLKGVYFARTDWLQANPGTVEDIIRAQLEANSWFHENREGWIKLAMEFVPGSTRGAVERLYDDLKAIDMFPLDGGMTEDGAKATVELMVDAEQLKEPISVGRFLETQYLRKVLGK